jgi:hypothetical protein
MRWWLRTFKAAVFQRDREEAEMSQELNLHMERRAEDFEQKGLSKEEAKRKSANRVWQRRRLQGNLPGSTGVPNAG